MVAVKDWPAFVAYGRFTCIKVQQSISHLITFMPSFVRTKINNNALSDKLKHPKVSLKRKLDKQIWRLNMARIVPGNYIGLCLYI
jgi:hypothetical protein